MFLVSDHCKDGDVFQKQKVNKKAGSSIGELPTGNPGTA